MREVLCRKLASMRFAEKAIRAVVVASHVNFTGRIPPREPSPGREALFEDSFVAMTGSVGLFDSGTVTVDLDLLGLFQLSILPQDCLHEDGVHLKVHEKWEHPFQKRVRYINADTAQSNTLGRY